jgi:PAS domain-containing protein
MRDESIRLPNPKVSQAHLARVLGLQQGLVLPYFWWLKAANLVRDELRSLKTITGPTVTTFYYMSIGFHTALQRLEEAQEQLRDTLTKCHNSYAPGPLKPIVGDVPIVRGCEDYPIQFAPVLPHIVVMRKTLDGRVLWTNRNARNISDVPLDEMSGKNAAEIWREQGGELIYEHDGVTATTGQPQIYQEPLQFQGIILNRIAIRFILPDEAGRSCLAVIGFNADGDLAPECLKKPGDAARPDAPREQMDGYTAEGI